MSSHDIQKKIVVNYKKLLIEGMCLLNKRKIFFNNMYMFDNVYCITFVGDIMLSNIESLNAVICQID